MTTSRGGGQGMLFFMWTQNRELGHIVDTVCPSAECVLCDLAPISIPHGDLSVMT